MSVPRLGFLYPQFFKTVKACESKLPRATPRSKKFPRNSAFCTSARKAEEAYPQRYGAAAEPQKPPPGAAESPGVITTLANAIETEVKAQNEKKNEAKSDSTRPSTTAGGSQAVKQPPESSLESQTLSPDNMPQPSKLDGHDVHPRDPVIPTTINTLHGKSLDTVLLMGNSGEEVENHKYLHMHPSPHVHHFDTFKLVRDLENGGFSEQQSVRLMKAVRSLLAMNLRMANESLVSKSDVENVGPPQYRHPLPLSPPVPQTNQLSSTCAGNLSLSSCLFRAPHGVHEYPQSQQLKNGHSTRPLAARSRHTFTKSHPGQFGAEG